MNFDPRPIGVFDSGIGGLTVLRELVRQFPHENFLYLGDTARLPYGSKSPETVRKYSEQNMKFLVSRDVKALVVACNTASAQVSEDRFMDRPVYNVIDPGSVLAAQKTENKKVGVIGTRAMVKTDSYRKKIQALDSEIAVFSVACPLFVPLAEEGWSDDPITNLIAFRYLQGLKAENVDTVVLGCTHYPLLKIAIQKVFGNYVHLVDSGQAISQQMEKDFASGKIIQNSADHAHELRITLTDFGPQFESLTFKLLSEVSSRPISFETVSVI